ncbi:hypothetical protein [Paenibacillus sp. TC-CSREp1]|uniref:hypothetical protein n=1 Tax=Paenibacillus sp. TC-CSREp1 TaxID=3410089 RepID=UPI003CEAF6D6
MSSWIKWIWGTMVLVNLAVFIWFLVAIVKEVSDQADKKTIPLDLDAKEIVTITTGPRSDWKWTVLEPTEKPEIYKLTITEKLGIHKVYRINIAEGLSLEMK